MAGKSRVPYKLYKRGEIYHAYYSFVCENGQRIQLRETTGFTSLEQAERYCIQRVAELQKKSYQQASGELPGITLDEAFGRYYREKGQYNSRPEEMINRLARLKQDLSVRYLHEVTEPIINNFINKNKQTLSNATINRYLSLFSVVRRTAEEEWNVKTHKFKASRFKLKEPAENIKYLANWEIAQKIIDRAAEHLKPIIYTALYTAMREGNILGLKWENIDFFNHTINIRVKDRTTAGGKNHSIPMIPQLEEIFKSLPRINDYVFNYRNKPIKNIARSWQFIFFKYVRINPKDIKPGDVIENRLGANGKRHPYRKTLRDPSLSYINFHTLRHTAATWILKKTNNLRTTKEILGHSDIRTTLKYAHVLDEEKRNALNAVFGDK